MNRKRFLLFLILTLVWTGVIYSFSLEPADVSDDTSLGLIDWIVEYVFPWLKEEVAQLSLEQMSILHNLVRKMAHFTEYFILGVLSTCTMMQTNMKRLWKRAICSIGFCVLAASIDEIIQLFVEGRAGRIGDVLIDSSGAATGTAIVLLGLWIITNKISATKTAEQMNREK